MPCYDPQDKDCAAIAQEREKNAVKEIKRLQNRCDLLANLLCSVGKASFRGEEIPPEVVKWWKWHMKKDADRGEPW